MVKFHPKKSLGQNFLVNRGVVEKIIQASELKPGERVLEVGPGRGILTQALLDSGVEVLAIEKDRRLVSELNKSFSGKKNIQIVDLDVLKLDPKLLGLSDRGYKIVANIPYYITSHLLKTIFTDWPLPSLIVLMVQREVAQRIVAKPPGMSLLALSVQFYGQPEIISVVRAGSFSPPPKIDSAILKIKPLAKLPPVDPEKFFSLIHAGFAHKRKRLVSNLAEKNIGSKEKISMALKKINFNDNTRPEVLTLPDWLRLAEEL